MERKLFILLGVAALLKGIKTMEYKDLDDAIREIKQLKELFKRYAQWIKDVEQTDHIESFRHGLSNAQIKLLEEMGYD